ncbi:MAG: dienelactone hydrolase family protein [Candidatus Thorarchaeota archaeon]
MPRVKINEIDITGHIAYPETKDGNGILVLHAWWGLNEFIKQFSERLAGEGFLVLAPDLYKGKIAKTIPEAENYSDNLDPQEINPSLKKLVDFFLNHPNCKSVKLSVIGFSLGASWATWLANAKPNEIEKVVLFYGTGDVDFSKTRALFQCHFAENDPYEETEYVNYFKEKLQKAKIEANHYTYPETHHWFFETNQGKYYNEKASKLAWQRTLEFLKE